MEMRLSKIFFICLIVLYACKGGTQENKNIKNDTKFVEKTPNFFNKKYQAQYSMVVDESTPADHPMQTFLDCNDSYFTIHYVPKSRKNIEFWKENYLKNQDIDNEDFKKESIEIGKKINSNITDYVIFCYYVPSKFIKTNSICSDESVYLDDNTDAIIYYYSIQEKKWNQIGDEKSNILPKVIDSKYFMRKFPNYFKSERLIQNITTPNPIKQGYQILLEKKADINLDGKMDEIFVYGTKWEGQPGPTDFKTYKVVINLSIDNTFRTLTNNKIIEPYYPNNVASGFSDVKVKGNYFTIEQANGGAGSIVESFTTFKYDKQKKEIYLYKYSTITIQQSSGDEETSELTTKNFGIITFEDFNVENLNRK